MEHMMKDAGRDVLYVVGWSLFWVLVISGVALLVLQWQLLERAMGL